jgi:hypothetical protein
VTKCFNCGRLIVGEGGSRRCSDCGRIYRRGWEDGWTAPMRNGVHWPVEVLPEMLCDDDSLARLTVPQVRELVGQIDSEQRWRDGDGEVGER